MIRPVTDELPLTEDDLDGPGLIEPTALVRSRPDLPGVAVACFFAEVLAAQPGARPVSTLKAEHGTHQVWELERPAGRVLAFHPGVGAPLAAAFVEEMIAKGVRTIVAVGGAGGLRPELTLGHAVVVDRALRDEGTSFHYAAASRWIDADPHGVRVLQQTLTAAGTPALTGAAWTTDAIYRETRARTDRRIGEGCLVVEMEAAALIAVARYRRVRLAHLLYAGDTLAEPEWDARAWQQAGTVREALFEIAVDAALSWHAAPDAGGAGA